VDDNSSIRKLYKRIIEHDDDDVVLVGEATNGREAVEMIADTTPDVVVMDIQMPVLDGVHATQLIKERWPRISVVGCTASDDSELVGAMKAAGAEVSIDKTQASTLLVPLLKALGAPPVVTPLPGDLEVFLDREDAFAERPRRPVDVAALEQQVAK